MLPLPQYVNGCIVFFARWIRFLDKPYWSMVLTRLQVLDMRSERVIPSSSVHDCQRLQSMEPKRIRGTYTGKLLMGVVPVLLPQISKRAHKKDHFPKKQRSHRFRILARKQLWVHVCVRHHQEMRRNHLHFFKRQICSRLVGDGVVPAPSPNLIMKFPSHRNPKSEIGGASQATAIRCVGLAHARRFLGWKRKNGIQAHRKVFIITGWYPCVKEALIARGWVQNPDRSSSFFHLKWTLTSQHLSWTDVQPWQCTNHFHNTRSLVTKIGLSQSLGSLVWCAHEDSTSIFPRCYDMRDPVELREFIEDFRGLEAMAIMTVIINLQAHTRAALVSSSYNSGDIHSRYSPTCQSSRINTQIFEAAMSICWKHYKDLSDHGLDEGSRRHGTHCEPMHKLILDSTVEALGTDCDLHYAATILAQPLDMHRLLEDAEKAASSRVTPKDTCHIKFPRIWERVIQRAAQPGKALSSIQITKAAFVLEQLRARYPQCAINSDLGASCSKNLWIVKPAAKSRGRGIAVFRRLTPLLKYCDMISMRRIWSREPEGVTVRTGKKVGYTTRSQGGCNMWIVQKYIENQLLIGNRKFDIRQWVLVTRWNPLTIWFYGDCYARFSAAEFTLSDTSLNNKYIHLVNNSISKTSSKFHEEFIAENGVGIMDCMWTLRQLRNYLNWRHHQAPFSGNTSSESPRYNLACACGRGDCTGRIQVAMNDVFYDYIQPAMKRMVIWALLCSQEHVVHRPNSWEVYGFDFMLDKTASPWLIEINSSPACDYSTLVTENFVKFRQCRMQFTDVAAPYRLIACHRRALSDVLKVTLDFDDWNRSQRQGNAPATGDWTLIYCGNCLDTSVASFGDTKLSCEGIQFIDDSKRRYRRAPPIPLSRNDQTLAGTVVKRRNIRLSVDHAGNETPTSALLIRPPEFVQSGTRPPQFIVANCDRGSSGDLRVLQKSVTTKQVTCQFLPPIELLPHPTSDIPFQPLDFRDSTYLRRKDSGQCVMRAR